MNNLIEEIKKNRVNSLTDKQKKDIEETIKHQLLTRDYALIRGAAHFRDAGWYYSSDNFLNEAPFKSHPAIATYCEELGFCTRRHYNNGGIDQGLEIYFV